MTYCLIWNMSNMVFFVADAAITSGRPLRSPLSSFGETHGTGSLNVEQAALKIFRLPNNTGLTFAGDVKLGHDLVRSLDNQLRTGVAVDEAIGMAFRNIGPISARLNLTAAVGRVNAQHSQLFRVDAQAGHVDQLGPGVLQLGSINEEYRKLSSEFLIGLAQGGALNAKGLTVSAMALVQSYGVHHNMIAQGVGGHVTGACIDEDGWHWHPDLAFVLYASGDLTEKMNVVTNVVRDDVVCVASSLIRETRCFAHELSDSQQAEWMAKWDEDISATADKKTFEYVIFLDTRYWRVVMIEMQHQREHRHLKWIDGTAEVPGEFALSPHLASILTKDMGNERLTMTFLAFEPPP